MKPRNCLIFSNQIIPQKFLKVLMLVISIMSHLKEKYNKIKEQMLTNFKLFASRILYVKNKVME